MNILRIGMAPRSSVLLGALLLSSILSTNAARGVQDVMLQTVNGKIVTGEVNDLTGVGTLGKRVYGGQFSLVSGTFRSSNPGFFGLRSGDPKMPDMPPGAAGFPANHDVFFDLLPMTIGQESSNLFYWDGSDANGGGVDLSDVNFVVPTGVFWEQRDDNFMPYTAYGTDQVVSGGLIDRSSDDVWPDGIDSGTLHAHLAMLVNDTDGNSGTTPPAGIYMISWQARSEGFDTSDPFFFVLRSPTISDAVRNVAVAWVDANIEMLTAPTRLPGDYNGDETVDAADYVVWRHTFGQSEGDLAADGDGSGEIGEGDYGAWMRHFGAANGGAAAGALNPSPVPEPKSLSLITIAACGFAMSRKRQLRARRCPQSPRTPSAAARDARATSRTPSGSRR